MIPAPPSTCTASVVAFIAVSAAKAFAYEPSRPASSPASQRGAGAPDEQARGLDLHRHLGQLERDALLRQQRLAERLPLARVVGRVLERGARDADGAGRDLRPRVLEEVHRDEEALAVLPEQAVGRNARVLEDERAGVRGAEAELQLLPARRRRPGSSRSTRNALIPASVRAKTTVSSAMPPFVT